ncbi:hypothetical protein T265_10533 [Opisthorchis viverrini]|uniref:Peptidase A1 domain-containing protein n=1 Tax=Opisthorchis viverrini TaxID=6198 RepID=A0A075A0X7_OPIVI|nr:hypothetical protein T265_10533 [Opisthorchis viverrini]KER21064.1 hypothetical protein T265_10533 [Opisthorchis viverrini]
MYRDISNIVATETRGGLAQHIQLPGHITNERFSWVLFETKFTIEQGSKTLICNLVTKTGHRSSPERVFLEIHCLQSFVCQIKANVTKWPREFRNRIPFFNRRKAKFYEQHILLACPPISILNNSEDFYYGIVGIGTPPKEFRLLFDTGSPILWVHSKNARHDLRPFKNTFDPYGSSTFVDSTTEFKAKYANFEVYGFVSTDILQVLMDKYGYINKQIGGRSLSGTFGPVLLFKGQPTQHSWNDGILGLGRRQAYSQFKTMFVDQLFEQGLITRRTFAFVFCRYPPRKATVIFGEITKDHIPGDVSFVKVSKTEQFPYHWVVLVNRIELSIGGTLATGVHALVDTGTPMSYLPADLTTRLYALIGVRQQATRNVVDCNRIPSMPTLRFNFGSFELLLESQQYIFVVILGLSLPSYRSRQNNHQSCTRSINTKNEVKNSCTALRIYSVSGYNFLEFLTRSGAPLATGIWPILGHDWLLGPDC